MHPADTTDVRAAQDVARLVDHAVAVATASPQERYDAIQARIDAETLTRDELNALTAELCYLSIEHGAGRQED